MKSIAFFILCSIFLGYACQPAPSSDTMERHVLKSLGSNESSMELEASLQLNKSQSGDRISFSLLIRNLQDEASTILNPVDFIQFMLLDETGIPVSTPPVTSRMKASPQEWDTLVNEYFPLVKVVQDGLEKDEESERKNPQIPIGANGSYEMFFEIRGVLNEAGDVVAVPPGSYNLQITFTLKSTASKKENHRILQSSPFPLTLTPYP